MYLKYELKPGDIVYHRKLNMCGTFKNYTDVSQSKCDVDFDEEVETMNVSACFLIKLN